MPPPKPSERPNVRASGKKKKNESFIFKSRVSRVGFPALVIGKSEDETYTWKLFRARQKNLNTECAAAEMPETFPAIRVAAEMAEIFAGFQVYQFPSLGWQG